MQISLHSPVRKNSFLLASLLFAVLYAGFAATTYLAAHFSEKPDLASLQRAVRLRPGNASYRYRVGRYFMLVERSPEPAVQSYRAALALNPHQARYWFDLAAAYQFLGNLDGQKDALEQAIVVDPRTPDVAWEAANLFLVQGDTGRALKEFRTVLEGDLALAGPALQMCLRASPDVDTILREVVPPSPQVYFTFIDVLMAKKQPAAAAKVWAQLAQMRQPLEKRRVLDYIQYLIAQKEVEQARLVWQQAGSLCSLGAYQPSTENLVINGDFSLEILNGGFDWLYRKSKYVSLALDPTQAHKGHRSLAIAFDGQGVEDAGIRQLIPVNPNTTYEFSGYFKAEQIQGAGGPQFVIQDLYSGTTYFASEDLKDADYWKQVSGTVKTGPDTKLLVLHVQRTPLGSPIRGKLWVDDLRLAPQSSQE